MPELPEVEALALDLSTRLEGHAIATVHIAAFSALKTFDPPLRAIEGAMVDGVSRHGKFLDVSVGGLHLVCHLARGGWIRWRDEVPTLPPRPGGKNPLAARVVLDDQAGLDITEAGTKKRLAIYLVRDPQEVPGIASLGPDPLTDDFTLERFRSIIAAEGRKQIKGVLRMQGTIAGIGNAYSDEILHAAKMSPYKSAASLLDGEDDTELVHLYDADPGHPGRRGRALARAGHERAQEREEVEPRGPRQGRPGLPRVRRHRARGVVRRLEPAVLPDLPDRREAAGRPADEQVPEVAALSWSCRSSRRARRPRAKPRRCARPSGARPGGRHRRGSRPAPWRASAG